MSEYALLLGVVALILIWDIFRRWVSQRKQHVSEAIHLACSLSASLQRSVDLLAEHDERNSRALESFLKQILDISKLSAEARSEIERKFVSAAFNKKV